MPWTKRQLRAAYAVKGGAKVGGMTKAFAFQVISEGVKGGIKRQRRGKFNVETRRG